MMAEDRIAVIRGLYEAFGAGEMDRIASLVETTEWHEAEGMPYGGIYHGSAEIFPNVFGRIAADVEGFSARPDELLEAGEDRVLALGRYMGKGSRGEVDAGYAHLWTVRDGRIIKFVKYADTHKFREAVGA